MLSRRHIRIKVMQLLYAKNRDAQLSLSDILRRYEQYGKRSIELYLFNLQHVVEVARYAVRDDIQRKAKYLPTEKDRRFTAKLYENEVLQGFLAHGTYEKALKKFQMSGRTDDDTISNFYRKFLETEVYQAYLATDDSSQETHRNIIVALYKFLMQSEIFEETMEDFSPAWIDDDTLILGATKKTLKAFPSDEAFIYDFNEEDKLTFAFGEELLTKVYNNNNELLELIKPMLQNWEADRVAAIDLILIKMAVCELTEFPTIPTKVTVNEYVDISKMYSTDKSREFVNGILDRMMKKFKEDGTVQKEGRGLVE
ncbi:MAG: transcription antitermination factor NusB [Saprospiraceae bacterium]|nr:transcription antitermination factor NusB [Saprospiraceae bacterium]